MIVIEELIEEYNKDNNNELYIDITDNCNR